LEKLQISPPAPAVSDRIGVDPASRKTPARIPDKTDEPISFLSGNPEGYAERNDLLFVYSECEHGPASGSQHVQNELFSPSDRACQEQNSHQFDFAILPPKSAG
jgi:hypothetical protein